MSGSALDSGERGGAAPAGGTVPYNGEVSQDSAAACDTEPRVLARAEHPISRRNIDGNALKVLYRLHNQGYKAYLCGGGVRDLLLDRRPKDFDVATDARPEELRRLFRNGRIIGRRFRLAHVIFRDSIVEVSTFRGEPDPEAQKREEGELLITSDNTFGTPREDAFRRDFTINALFYDISDFSVLDYVGGLADLEQKLVRVIGDPELRFREDPVRMMRACEFAGRLGFTIEARTQEAIERHREELLKAAPPRLTEELLALLRSGRAAAAVQWMLELGVLEVILPEAMAMVTARRRGAGDFGGILPTMDRLTSRGERLDDAVLLAAILLPQVMLKRFEIERRGGGWIEGAEFRDVVRATLASFQERFAVANHKRGKMEQALVGFHQLCTRRRTPAQRRSFARKSYFDDALALFRILVDATGEGGDALDQWRAAVRHRERRPEPEAVRQGGRRRRRRRS